MFCGCLRFLLVLLLFVLRWFGVLICRLDLCCCAGDFAVDCCNLCFFIWCLATLVLCLDCVVFPLVVLVFLVLLLLWVWCFVDGGFLYLICCCWVCWFGFEVFWYLCCFAVCWEFGGLWL